MWHDWIAKDKFFAQLSEEDEQTAAAVKAGGCVHCGGRLDRADYPRKPRGGAVGSAGEGQERRRSFCCAREGCRRRATPPSLVFLGRRVYLGIVLLVETLRHVLKAGEQKAGPARAAPSPAPRRTVSRWVQWFREELPRTRTFEAARGWLWPPVSPQELPQGLVARFSQRGQRPEEALLRVLRFLRPLSTMTAALEAP